MLCIASLKKLRRHQTRLGQEEPDGLHLRRSGGRGDIIGRPQIVMRIQDITAPCAHMQKKGFIIRRIGHVEIMNLHSNIPQSLGYFQSELLRVGKCVWRREDMDNRKGHFRKQRQHRTVRINILDGFGIERIMITGKCQTFLLQLGTWSKL